MGKERIVMIQEEPLYKSRQWLKRMYWREGLSSREIGKLCGVSHNAILCRLWGFGIERRKDGPPIRIGPGTYMSIFLPTYLHDALKKYSEKKKQSISGVVRRMLLDTMIKKGLNPFKED